jgi:hypothetical protein
VTGAWTVAILWSLPFAALQFVLDVFLLGPVSGQPTNWTLVVAATGIQFVAVVAAVRYMYRRRS